MQAHGFWLTQRRQFLLEIAADSMSRYRNNDAQSAETSLLIGFAWQARVSRPKERAASNLPNAYNIKHRTSHVRCTLHLNKRKAQLIGLSRIGDLRLRDPRPRSPTDKGRTPR